ncbi:hypothetical protein HB364_22030 [Pseudoflavitalea sp. X16]|uniref:hypothetical protein n=1 Tax=Paraflavitalea devenefica TaxID=2716334 RepID=UPI001424507C|nr:hypothetical protein [Paraflavitalea devenefica]NII27778.1 hypothetical protein [Paraflavitalea devenefica]
MKRVMQLVTITLVIFLCLGNPSTARHQAANNTSSAFFPYTWYYDVDMNDPVGAVSYVNTEMERLRDIYPGNVFQSSHSSGLREYEYGYFYYYPAAIIWTDLPYALTNSQGSGSTRR